MQVFLFSVLVVLSPFLMYAGAYSYYLVKLTIWRVKNRFR